MTYPASRPRDKLTFEPPAWVAPEPGDGGHSTYELSNLDQIFDYHNAVVLFFGHPPPLQGTENVTPLLQAALRELLLHCPWAAGRIRVNPAEQRMEVACAGPGALFLSARAPFPLSDLGDLAQPRPSLDIVFPCLPSPDDARDIPAIALQVTRFLCGAFALSLSSHHALLDGAGAGVFLQNLCSIAKGDGLPIGIDNRSRRELMPAGLPPTPPPPGLTTSLVPRRDSNCQPVKFEVPMAYRFQKEALQRLKKEAVEGNAHGVTSCSRYQALVALLWKAKAESLKGVRPQEDKLTVRVPVNVRERVMPALTRGYLGNAVCYMEAEASLQELQGSHVSFALQKVMAAMANVSPECVQAQTDLLEGIGGMGTRFDPRTLGVPTLVGLPFYQADCGWGPPLYVQRPCKQLSYSLIILDGLRDEPPSWHALVVCPSDGERRRFEEAIRVYQD